MLFMHCLVCSSYTNVTIQCNVLFLCVCYACNQLFKPLFSYQTYRYTNSECTDQFNWRLRREHSSHRMNRFEISNELFIFQQTEQFEYHMCAFSIRAIRCDIRMWVSPNKYAYLRRWKKGLTQCWTHNTINRTSTHMRVCNQLKNTLSNNTHILRCTNCKRTL